MALLPGKKLGSRVLRLGHKGPDVQQLHEFLRLQGYDLGEEQDFGYLTKDAVRRWQRDHGLVADGIAGKRFFALALNENLPIRRRVHVVEPKETLEQVAQRYELGPEAFGVSHKKTVYPGQRLIFFDREIWALCTNGAKSEHGRGAFTGLICSAPPSGGLPEPYVIRPATGENGDVVKVHHHLRTPRRRRKTARDLLEFIEGTKACGLYVPWRAVAPVDGRRYVKLIKRLRRLLKPPAMLWVELGPSVPSWRFWGGVDYAAVSQLVDRVVLNVPPPVKPGPLFERRQAEEMVESLVPTVHSWKILLKVPVYALLWEIDDEGNPGEGTRLPYQTALSRAFRHGARINQDDWGYSYYTYKQRGAAYHIRLPHHSLLAEISAVANRHNLAGLILDELGMEDPRLWQGLSRYFRTASLNISRE